MQDLDSQILVSKIDTIVIISLNRLPVNGYYLDFLERLSSIITEASLDDTIKVILIKSTSEKFFCAGADIKIFASNTQIQNNEMVKTARKVSAAICNSKKIVVAAIKGHVLGGGLEICMACDIRLAAKGDYLIGLPEVKLGLMPGNGGTPRLIDLIGASRAMELLVTGNTITPQKAYDYGLFNQLYEEISFENEVEIYVDKIAKGAGKAMSAIKEYVGRHKGMSLQESLIFETECVDILYNTPDAKEGFNAFVEKRTPEFE
ncbi:enoyl-CoA hydratase/isomerase family protein [Aquimarina sp. RZ0]|uniref:enoyl-CoA hydratase/isomerase family protein n=1 Tax=Aquimarina sp. RZ0 TaxID=2607730 RepID=UPI0011F164F9|nr:enoyl-CoA hydratase/isomerase family protein [Aquimarina sp. RZ0]KAA1246404.1 enoyl-CoA hydratase/isomerase family protein [Aquimarina sp. RZ0]